MKSVSKLTARQKAFLEKLLELYHEHKGPVHYSAVAERLGVNRFSAYDMLKVLEKKGFASSSYALRSAAPAAATGHTGPGRSMGRHETRGQTSWDAHSKSSESSSQSSSSCS